MVLIRRPSPAGDLFSRCYGYIDYYTLVDWRFTFGSTTLVTLIPSTKLDSIIDLVPHLQQARFATYSNSSGNNSSRPRCPYCPSLRDTAHPYPVVPSEVSLGTTRPARHPGFLGIPLAPDCANLYRPFHRAPRGSVASATPRLRERLVHWHSQALEIVANTRKTDAKRDS